jgi:serine/threonine protein kinase
VQSGLDNGRNYTLALRPGTLLDGDYRITRVLAQSSTFAVTYVAQDERAGDQVVVKEFLPRTVASRAPDELTVLPHSADDGPTLSRALRRFKREAELLAEIAHPNIPRVRRSFEANGTAYLVLQHYEGKTLAEHAAAGGNRLPADRATALVLQVLQALEALHAEGIIHGYITPDSVLVDANARALVLGLGTTRHVVGPGREPVAGFAPIEQYAGKEVGPWTDVYACAAVLYRLTTGLTPPSAVERSAGQMINLPLAAAANLPSGLARTVMSALAQLPDARPHSAEEFRRRLDASLGVAAQAMSPRIDERLSAARWPAADSLEPTRGGATAEPGSRSELPQFDDEGFVTIVDGPSDRVRRLLRPVLATSGAAAVVLFAVSAFGGRAKDYWANARGVAAAPAFAKSRTSPTTVDPPRVEKDSAPPTIAVARTARPSAPELVLKPAGDASPRAVVTQEVTPPRSRQSPAQSSGQGSTSRRAEPARATPAAGPPSITLSLSKSVGNFELVPSEVLIGLRERLAHGRENVNFGSYASARRIYRSALEHVATLADRYAGNPALLQFKSDFEQAAERALAACVAENEVRRRRNGEAVPCE